MPRAESTAKDLDRLVLVRLHDAGLDAKQAMSLLDAVQLTVQEIRRYRSGVRLAACLTRFHLATKVSTDPYGVPVYALGAGDPAIASAEVRLCRQKAAPVDRRAAQEEAAVSCATEAAEAALNRARTTGGRPSQEAIANDCLRAAFGREIDDVAPVPLRLYLGAVGQAEPSLTPGPVILAAILVALLAVAGTALLSRRVLRPIGTLTAASERLGEGDLSLRVPASGRDELGQLARSFNRMADSLQRGEERQRRMVADVAHELRSPLANLRGYLEALKDGVIPATPELYASLHEEAVLQQRIVDDLQELALAEAGALAYHKAPTDLAEVLETCRVAQQAAAESAGVVVLVEARGPVVVEADPDRIRQVIGNLLSNALRATPAGGTVTLSATGPVDGWATVVVRDTGAGIAAEDLPYIFDRFWRADPARGRTTGGIGLGLAIARQIVTDHGGRIAASSEVGVGTAVTIRLPTEAATR